MPPLGDLSDAVIGSIECERIEQTIPKAKVFTLKLFCKGISAENVFVLIAEVGGNWVLEMLLDMLEFLLFHEAQRLRKMFH